MQSAFLIFFGRAAQSMQKNSDVPGSLNSIVTYARASPEGKTSRPLHENHTTETIRQPNCVHSVVITILTPLLFYRFTSLEGWAHPFKGQLCSGSSLGTGDSDVNTRLPHPLAQAHGMNLDVKK